MPTTHLLYLHGFRSSPRSAKAQAMAHRVARDHPAVHWWAPQLPPSPREAMQMLMRGVAGWPRASMAVVGSSLGGFYATHVAAVCGCPAVLLNPAVDPARDLARYIGEQTQWHDPAEHFYFEPRYIDELRALEVDPLPPPARVMAIVAKGDEVIDWREMAARYSGCRLKLLARGNHALDDFETAHLPEVLRFLDLA